MTMLDVSGLTCRHGLLAAVQDVSLTLDKGDALCIIGANGAGKSTLMRSLAGVHAPASGSITLGGTDVTRVPANKRVKCGIALCPEGRRLFGDMTVRENLQIASENGRQGEWTIDRVLSTFDQLKPFEHRLAEGLSGGQRQAVAIGRALLANPDVLLLDEVSLGLSPVAVDGVYDALEEVRNARTMSMIVVEQDLGRALGFADKIACMTEGKIKLSGTPSQFTREEITDAYFGIQREEVPHV